MGAYVLVSVLILITCSLLILVVLVQNSKGGGLAANFSGSNQYMGVRKTGDFLEKSTWVLAIMLLLLSLSTIFVIPRNENGQNRVDTELRDQIDNTTPFIPVQDYQAPPPKEDSK